MGFLSNESVLHPPLAQKDSYLRFSAIMKASVQPVVLLEGRRELCEEDQPKLVSLAERLAASWLNVMFRTGNARGSDTLFAKGLANVSPSRIEYILPYRGMGSERAPVTSTTLNLDEIPDEEAEYLRHQCKSASPRTRHAFERPYWEIQDRHTAFSARYLLRDALKIHGSPSLGIPVATCAIFYVEPGDPDAGGTGHTLRLCELNRIPYFTQHEWFSWLENQS